MRTALIELHIHLDGSLYLPWAYEVAKRVGSIPAEATYEDFNHILYRKDYKSREEGFLKFKVACDCMQTKEDIHDSVYYLARELEDLGLIYAEVRFAPQQHCLMGLTQDEVVAAAIEGVKDAAIDFPNVMIKLLLCLMHKGDAALVNDAENRETIAAAEKYLPGGIVVGLDLAGYENNCPYEDYAYLFDIAREKRIPYTIHAAEMGDGSHIMPAIDRMKAYRIGHGIDSVQNPAWLAHVVETQIPLEVCVSSNCAHGLIRADHPIFTLKKAGAKFCLNSDNMMFTETDLTHEHQLLLRHGFTKEDLMETTYTAIEAAFCSDEEKKMLKNKADRIYGRR